MTDRRAKLLPFRKWVHRTLGLIRRALWFPLFHVEPPAPPQDDVKLVYLKTRVRRMLTRTARALFFPLYFTGQETARGRGLLRLAARARKVATRAARARFFPLYHTGASPAPPGRTIVFQVRRRSVFPTRHRVLFYLEPVWLFAGPPVPPAVGTPRKMVTWFGRYFPRSNYV